MLKALQYICCKAFFMRYIRYVLIALLMPVYLPAKVFLRLSRYFAAYADYIRFKRRYKGKAIPLTGYQVYRWQVLNRHDNPFYRPIWYILCKYLRANPGQLNAYYIADALQVNSDLLTPDNWDTFNYKKT